MGNLQNVQGCTYFSMHNNVSSELRPETMSHFISPLLPKCLLTEIPPYSLLVLGQMYITLVTFYDIFDAMFFRNCVVRMYRI